MKTGVAMEEHPQAAEPMTGSRAILYGAFAGMGFCTALLGAALPALRPYWSLTDRTSGVLFLMFFLGSSSGPLMTRGDMVYSIARGAALIAGSGAVLGWVQGAALFPVFYLFGLGVGITTTSITVLRSAKSGESRLRELNLLNVIWPLGALVCPTVANAAIRSFGVGPLFTGIAAFLGVVALWMLQSGRHPALPSEKKSTEGEIHRKSRLPWMMAALAFLAVGLESATGAWIASYSHQLPQGTGAIVEAATLFWLGLLASRLFHATPWMERFTELEQLRNGALLTTIGALLLVGLPLQGVLLLAAFLMGFGAGPIYPTVLSLVLPRVSGTLIFLLAGLGGASLPWLVGMISAQAGTLRVGMLVPACAACVVFGLTTHAARILGQLDALKTADTSADLL